MAGLMGGIMGAMTSVMALNDNLKIFIPVLVVSIISIIIGLIYMIYEQEVKERETINYGGFHFLPFITVIFVIVIGLTFLMVYGPKSFLFN